MVKKVLSATGTALGRLLTFIVKHPKQSLIVGWSLLFAGYLAWRYFQPFDKAQPILIVLGPVAALIGGVSLLLERRDGPRKGATLMSWVAMFVGATLLFFGLRPI